jgi:hypothetical protein
LASGAVENGGLLSSAAEPARRLGSLALARLCSIPGLSWNISFPLPSRCPEVSGAGELVAVGRDPRPDDIWSSPSAAN